jgi:hypothetical protein
MISLIVLPIISFYFNIFIPESLSLTGSIDDSIYRVDPVREVTRSPRDREEGYVSGSGTVFGRDENKQSFSEAVRVDPGNFVSNRGILNLIGG